MNDCMDCWLLAKDEFGHPLHCLTIGAHFTKMPVACKTRITDEDIAEAAPRPEGKIKKNLFTMYLTSPSIKALVGDRYDSSCICFDARYPEAQQDPYEMLEIAKQRWESTTKGVLTIVLQKPYPEDGFETIIVHAKHVPSNRTVTLFSVIRLLGSIYPITILPKGEKKPNFLATSKWASGTYSKFCTKLNKAFNLSETRAAILSLTSSPGHSEESLSPDTFVRFAELPEAKLKKKGGLSGKWRLLEPGEEAAPGDQFAVFLDTGGRMWFGVEFAGPDELTKENSPPIRRKIK